MYILEKRPREKKNSGCFFLLVGMEWGSRGGEEGEGSVKRFNIDESRAVSSVFVVESTEVALETALDSAKNPNFEMESAEPRVPRSRSKDSI